MVQLTRVHGHHQLGRRRIGEHETGILGRDPRFQQFAIKLVGSCQMSLKPGRQFRLGGDAHRHHRVERRRVGDVALALLRIGGNPVAHQLMRTGAADPLDAEGEIRMLEHRQVAQIEDLAQQPGRLLRSPLQQLADARIGVAEARRCGHHLLWVGSMGQELNTHGPSPSSWTAPSGNRAESRDGTRKGWITALLPP